MAIQVGTVKSITGVVKAIDPETGVERILTAGSPVFQGERIETMNASSLLIDMKNGELVTLGSTTILILNDDVVPANAASDEAAVPKGTLDAMLAAGQLNIDNLDLNELEATAAGEEGSANEGGVTIARLGLEGSVTSGFDTNGLGGGVAQVAEDAILLGGGSFTPPDSNNTPPNAIITDNGSRLIGLVGADQAQGNTGTGSLSQAGILDLGGLLSISGSLNTESSASSPLFGGQGNTLLELGALDVVNYQPKKEFIAEDKEDEIQQTEMSIDNGVGQDLLGLSKVIGNNEFDAPENDSTHNYDVSDDGQTVTVSRKDGRPMTEDEANAAMSNVEIKDTSVLGSLLSSGVIIGGTYGLSVTDAGGLNASTLQRQFLDVNLLQNGTNDGLGGLVDVPLLNVLDPVTGMLDDALGNTDEQLLNTVGDVLDTVDSVTDVLDPVLTPVGDILNEVGNLVTGLTDSLGKQTPLGDPMLGETLADGLNQGLQPLVDAGSITEGLLDGLNVDPGLGLTDNLLGGEPDEEITAGLVDDIVDQVTDVVDDLTAGLGLPTDTENLDDGLNAVTTDVDDLLNGDQDLQQVLGSLLGGEPDEAIKQGSADQVVDGVTDVVDDLTAGLGLPTDTENLDDGLNAVTTDVDDLLNGDQDLQQVLGSLLGGEPDEAIKQGSADQVVDGVTDVVDDLTAGLGLPTDTENLDDGLNAVTTDVDDLLNGDQDLQQVLGSLLGGEPDEAIKQGSADQVVDGVTDVVDDLTAGLGLPTDTENLDDGLNAVTTDVDDLLQGEQELQQVLGSLLGGEPGAEITQGSADQVVDGVTDVVDDLTAGLGLPTDTENLDDGLNAVTTDVDDLLQGEQELLQVVGSLLGGEPGAEITQGSADQVVDGATDVVDDLTAGLGLPTDSENLDDGLNAVTTDVDDLLQGEQELLQVVGSLLGGEPGAEITQGSADQVVDGATDVVDDLTAGLGLPTDTENLDDGLNAVTTDVDDLLQGEQSLDEAIGSLLGGNSDQGTAGSVDQLVDGVTDLIGDDGLGLVDDNSLDDLFNDTTTIVSDLLGGTAPQVENESSNGDNNTSVSNDLLSLNLVTDLGDNINNLLGGF
ncbi:hypothetical protein THMIRHAS_01180 [Thiosulfatimonas sediminis]|uniref:Retention module-containing protein n=1 Tax=Thiosulfatimonas sediminis TaxID=2675054 RepID=A0A6F8PRK2_9GAMM|nr:retention module-containing protein [Thiosulfatimonas sediminis]BBP44745.1 hypothetical protein THMIRHAS_01180 [Thiosulfatimonas sediminis]